MFAKIKEVFYELSEEEKMQFMLRDRKNLDELRCKVLMMIDCRWSNEEWNYIGVEEWPTLEALEKQAAFGWLGWCAGRLKILKEKQNCRVRDSSHQHQ